MVARSGDYTSNPAGAGSAVATAVAKLLTRGSQRSLLVLSFSFLVVGNLPRFIPLPGFRHSQNILELVVLLAGVCTALLNPRIARVFASQWLPFWAIVLGSCIYGALLNGFSVAPSLYAVRLVLLCLAAFATAYCLRARYGADIEAVLKFGTYAFLLVAVIGILQLYLLPDLWLLWKTLAEAGITFHGDPHQGRLVSTYFDPNFYSIIGCMYLITAFILWQSSGSTFRTITVWLIVGSILLTGSRAGIATLFATVLAIAWVLRHRVLRTVRALLISRQAARFGMLTVAAGIAGAPVYMKSVLRMWQRLMHVNVDASAQSRFDSFWFGIELFERNPLLGFGYNYHSPYVMDFNGQATLDSSVLVTFVSFGIIFGSVLLLLFVKWAIRTRAKMVAWVPGEPRLLLFFDLLLCYLGIVFVFSCHTVNALYYPLWFFPAVMFGSYLGLLPWPEETRRQGIPAPRPDPEGMD